MTGLNGSQLRDRTTASTLTTAAILASSGLSWSPVESNQSLGPSSSLLFDAFVVARVALTRSTACRCASSPS